MQQRNCHKNPCHLNGVAYIEIIGAKLTFHLLCSSFMTDIFQMTWVSLEVVGQWVGVGVGWFHSGPHSLHSEVQSPLHI